MYINLEIEEYVYTHRGIRYRVSPTIPDDSHVWEEIKEYFEKQGDYSGSPYNFGAWLLRQEMSGNLAAKLLGDVLRQLPQCSRQMASSYERRNEVEREEAEARGRARGLKLAKGVLRYAKNITQWGTFQKESLQSKLHYWTGTHPFLYIYFLINDGQCVYVGQAKSLKDRIRGHTDKDYDCIKYILVNPEYVDAVESAFIEKYKPKYNESMGNSKGVPFSLWKWECETTHESIQAAIKEVFNDYADRKHMDKLERERYQKNKKRVRVRLENKKSPLTIEHGPSVNHDLTVVARH